MLKVNSYLLGIIFAKYWDFQELKMENWIVVEVPPKLGHSIGGMRALPTKMLVLEIVVKNK